MIKRFSWPGRDSRGAVAPTVAMALFALIGAGGIAFDYARLASLDTELQQAADQAALAAASQLDRASGARTRATDAITADGTTKDRLAANFTRFANDGNADGTAVEIDAITFCKSFDDSIANTATACVATTVDTEARFVIVTTSVRTAEFALTPIVGAFSGSTSATAVAGIESSICNVAPLLVCVPDDFPGDDDIGKGLVLKPLDGISGNFGLLDFGRGTPAVTAALLGNGLNGCQSTDDNETEPGTKTTVTDAINTRMDVYAKNNPNIWSNTTGPKCNLTTGSGCPASSTRKDMVVKVSTSSNNVVSSTPPAALTCPANPYAAGNVFEVSATPVKGFARDNCHYSNTCGTGINGNIGNGLWDIAGYIAANHPGVSGATIASQVGGGKTALTLTRYDIYKWELADPTNRLSTRAHVTTQTTLRNNGRYDHTVTTQCTYSQPKFGTTGYPAQKDRRILPIVAANCENLRGKGQAYEDYLILRVFDVLLTEPSEDRTYPGVTNNKEIYSEVIGPAEPQGGGGGFQYYSRSRPYLVR